MKMFAANFLLGIAMVLSVFLLPLRIAWNLAGEMNEKIDAYIAADEQRKISKRGTPGGRTT